MLSELFHQVFSDNWVMQQQVRYGFDSFLVDSDTLDKIHFVLYKKNNDHFVDRLIADVIKDYHSESRLLEKVLLFLFKEDKIDEFRTLIKYSTDNEVS